MRLFPLVAIVCAVLSTQVFAQDEGAEGRLIELKTAIGTTFQGYFVGPQNSDKAMLLLHDRWGLNHTMRERAKTFAARGYLTLAIDMFDERASDELALATEIMDDTDIEAAKINVLTGLAYLQTPERKVVVMGWGFGGQQSYLAALSAPEDVAAAVVWYAPLYANIYEARAVTAPLLAIFARDDEWVTPSMLVSYKQLKKKSKTVYRNYVMAADHGFSDPQYASYQPRIEATAWAHVDRFLAAFVEN